MAKRARWTAKDEMRITDAYRFWSRRVGLSVLVGNAGGLAAMLGFFGASGRTELAQTAAIVPTSLFAVGLLLAVARDGGFFLWTWRAFAHLNEVGGWWGKPVETDPKISLRTWWTQMLIVYLPLSSGAAFVVGLIWGLINILGGPGGGAGAGVCST